MGSKTIRVDLTPPNAPKVSVSESQTSNPQPTWSWTSSGSGGNGQYRFKLASSDLQNGATITSDTVFSPSTPLSGGTSYTLFVQERDSAGNWSNSGFNSILIHGQFGYSVGAGGTILKTTNGGSSWKPLPSGTGKVLQSTHFFDGLVGLVFGATGTILRTTDGGTSWDTLSLSTGGYFNSSSFPNDNLGFIAADDGTIGKTADGGKTWTSKVGGGYFLGIHFPSSTVGYAVGLSGKIIKTTNSGETWVPLISDSIPDTYLRSVYFTDTLTGYVSGDNGIVIKTVDGGNSWKRLPTQASNAIHSIFFPTQNVGFGVGLYSVFRTEDAGATWTEKVISTHPLMSIFFQDSMTGYTVGASGAMFKTVNGGNTWNELNTGSSQTLYSISVP